MTKLVFRQFSKITGKQLYWNHQWEFIKDIKTRNLALVCGFNAGKTYCFLKKTLYCHLNIMTIDSVLEWQESGENPLFQPTSVGYVVYPTFPLAERLFVKPFIKMFKMKVGEDIRYDAKNHVLTSSYGTIIVISMTNADHIIGDSACFVGIDEFDKEKTDKAIEVYDALQGRLRANGFKEGELKYKELLPKNRRFIHPVQLYLVTTPEGYKATYIKFEKEKTEGTRLIRGRTLDNKAVSSDYVERLKDEYKDSPKLKAYLEGIFVNMKGKTVYQFFDRDKHLAKSRVNLNISLKVNLCFDFNVEPYCVAICQDTSVFNQEKEQNIIKHEKSIKVIDEIILKGGKSNSYDIVAEIIARIPKEANIELYGDASGNSHKTSAISTDWEIIMQGLEPHFRSVEFAVERSNPPIEHRVNTVNYHLRKNHIEINPHCEFLINDLEQVSYKENGQFDTSNKMLTHISDAFGYYIYKLFSIYNR